MSGSHRRGPVSTDAMAPALWWRGANIPNDIADTLARIGPLRGDEVFTEEIAMALASGNERCLVVALAARSIPAGPTPDTGDAPDTGPATFAVVTEDVRSEARRWTVETVAPGNLPSLHHDLLRAVANHHQCPSLLFWRPPTTPAAKMHPRPALPRPEGSDIPPTLVSITCAR